MTPWLGLDALEPLGSQVVEAGNREAARWEQPSCPFFPANGFTSKRLALEWGTSGGWFIKNKPSGRAFQEPSLRRWFRLKELKELQVPPAPKDLNDSLRGLNLSCRHLSSLERVAPTDSMRCVFFCGGGAAGE